MQTDALSNGLGTSGDGYRIRRLMMPVGENILKIPKPMSGTHFPNSLIKRYSQCDRTIVCAVATMRRWLHRKLIVCLRDSRPAAFAKASGM